MKLKQKAAELKTKIAALYLALRRKDTPFIAKMAAGITVGYALSPIDLIPDFIPLLGLLDDLILLPCLIALCIRLIPKDIMRECEAQAAGLWKEGKPKKWYYAIPIAILWLLAAALILFKIILPATHVK